MENVRHAYVSQHVRLDRAEQDTAGLKRRARGVASAEPMPNRDQTVAACVRIAARQHGVLSASQAMSAGLSAPAVRRLVRAGVWKRVRPCVYALWLPEARDDRWHQRLSAASLWLGDQGAVSHRAAATVFELDGIESAPLEVVTTGGQQASEAGMVLHRVRVLRRDEVVIRNGIRVTAVPRTLVDLCSVSDHQAVELAFECALRRRLASIEQIAEALAGRQGAGGRWVLSSLIERFPGVATDSALEVIVWDILIAGGLPPPIRQYEIRSGRGAFVARVDLAYPEALLAIEADGREFHSSRRDWQRDRSRQNALVRLGWTVYRVTWEDANRRPARVVADVRALLG